MIHLFMATLLIADPIIQNQEQSDSSNSPWVDFGGSGTQRYSGKASSFSYSKYKDGSDTIGILGQVHDNGSNDVKYYQWIISSKHCKDGMGKLVVGGIDGKYLFSSDYVEDGDSMASTIGTILCSVYKSRKDSGK